eukprot:scaffold326281_cov94-Tisochrysis_lutea.AAC.2
MLQSESVHSRSIPLILANTADQRPRFRIDVGTHVIRRLGHTARGTHGTGKHNLLWTLLSNIRIWLRVLLHGGRRWRCTRGHTSGAHGVRLALVATR